MDSFLLRLSLLHSSDCVCLFVFAGSGCLLCIAVSSLFFFLACLLACFFLCFLCFVPRAALSDFLICLRVFVCIYCRFRMLALRCCFLAAFLSCLFAFLRFFCFASPSCFVRLHAKAEKIPLRSKKHSFGKREKDRTRKRYLLVRKINPFRSGKTPFRCKKNTLHILPKREKSLRKRKKYQ